MRTGTIGVLGLHQPICRRDFLNATRRRNRYVTRRPHWRLWRLPRFYGLITTLPYTLTRTLLRC
jgi:hypothetical protein